MIASKGTGCVTANGRESDDNTLCKYSFLRMLFILASLTVAKDVFNNNQVIAASDAFSNVTGNVFLGRPWGGE